MADQLEVSQLIVQAEWSDPPKVAVSQLVVQVEYATGYSQTLGENLSFSDSAEPLPYLVTLSDGLSLSDAASYRPPLLDTLAESLVLSDAAIPAGNFEQLSEGLSASDSILYQAAYNSLVEELAGFSELLLRELGVSISDEVTLFQELLRVNWDSGHPLSERLSLPEKLVPSFGREISDGLTVSEILASGLSFAVRELLALSDTTRLNQQAGVLLAELLQILDSPGWETGFGAELAEEISFSDLVLPLYGLVLLLSESATLDAGLLEERGSYPVLENSITLSEELTPNGIWQGELEEVLKLRFSITLDGELYQCWCFTQDEMYPSVFTNYGFNSFAVKPDGTGYAAGPEGIYLLEGESDAGRKIESGALVNFFSFGTHFRKQIHDVWFGLAGERPVVRLRSEEGEATYYVVNGRARPSKGARGKTWELAVADIDALEFIEVTPVILSR